MKNKNLKFLIFTAFLFLLYPQLSLAQNVPATNDNSPLGLLKKTGPAAGYAAGTTEYSLSAYVGSIIFIFLSLLGVIFLILTFYAGYLWFTAGGDEKKVEKAKDYLKNGVIGMIIVLASLGVTNFIVFRLIQASQNV